MKRDEPYIECATCKTLTDCPCPDVAFNGMGSPLPPDCCPRPIDVMRDTEKARKRLRETLRKPKKN